MTLKCLAVGCAFLTVLAINLCHGAPRPYNTELLEKSLAEYLRHDQTLIKELQSIGTIGSDFPETGRRLKRQSELDDAAGEQDIMGDQGEEDKQPPGFFDRAAKFVVELLQRFLRWINSDNR